MTDAAQLWDAYMRPYVTQLEGSGRHASDQAASALKAGRDNAYWLGANYITPYLQPYADRLGQSVGPSARQVERQAKAVFKAQEKHLKRVARQSRSYLPKALAPQPYMSPAAKRGASIVALGAMALAGAAFISNRHAQQAERKHQPKGKFVTANGVRLHCLERGQGSPVVLLHGNGLTLEDFIVSGLFDYLARSHRVIAFDRPGFGHSERPSDRFWSAEEQAALLPQAFSLLGIEKPIVLAHSHGTQIALALALDHPQSIGGLVLEAGYYFPTARADVAMLSAPSIPVFGSLISYTVAPLIGEAMASSMMRKMFAPQAVASKFQNQFPIGLSLRPSQIQAFSRDAAMMITAAATLSERYRELDCPITILAGGSDHIVDFQGQAMRLHRELPDAKLDVFSGAGHMLHYVDMQRVAKAVEDMAVDFKAVTNPECATDQATASAVMKCVGEVRGGAR
jgi:pimeloyl-ACP methyl ester carboxylesterase